MFVLNLLKQMEDFFVYSLKAPSSYYYFKRNGLLHIHTKIQSIIIVSYYTLLGEFHRRAYYLEIARERSLSAFGVHTMLRVCLECTQSVLGVHSVCAQASECTQNALRVHSECTQSVLGVHSECAQSTVKNI